MKEYTLVLSTYNLRQTVKIELSDSELELMNDIKASLQKQNATIMLEVEDGV